MFLSAIGTNPIDLMAPRATYFASDNFFFAPPGRVAVRPSRLCHPLICNSIGNMTLGSNLFAKIFLSSEINGDGSETKDPRCCF